MSDVLMRACTRLRWLVPVGAVVLLAWGCATRPTGGTLVIAGGGLRTNADRVYARLLEHALDGPILILPQASASPTKSAAAVTARLRQIDPNRETVVYTARSGQSDQGGLSAPNDTTEAIGGAWFTGGHQSRIADDLLPPDGDGVVAAQLRALLDRGGVVGGTSAGAAVMSDPMILGGRSDAVLAGHTIALRNGLGFFPYGILDQHFMHRGRLGRMVVALEQSGVAHGFGIDEGCAIVVDLQSHTVEVIGAGGLLFVDASMMKRDAGAWRGLRVSLYADGAVLDARTGELLDPARVTPALQGHGASDIVVIEGDPWTKGRLREAFAVLQTGDPRIVEVRGDAVVVRLSMDAMSESAPPSVLGVRLDVE